jgi:hypothetical protein
VLFDNISELVVHDFEAFKFSTVDIRVWHDRRQFADGIPNLLELEKLIVGELQFWSLWGLLV